MHRTAHSNVPSTFHSCRPEWTSILLRTYDIAKGTGGSNGCTMRILAEQADPENAGLQRARDRLMPVYESYKDLPLSLADMYAIAGRELPVYVIRLPHWGGHWIAALCLRDRSFTGL